MVFVDFRMRLQMTNLADKGVLGQALPCQGPKRPILANFRALV